MEPFTMLKAIYQTIREYIIKDDDFIFEYTHKIKF